MSRDADGIGAVVLAGHKAPSARVPGKVLGFRLCFWAPAAGEIGTFVISRVAVRRYLEEMPTAEFGEVQAVK